MLALAVEDNEIHEYALKKNLESCGFEVVVAHDGLEGFSFVQTHKPNIVLIDANLPALNGYELCRRIRQLPEASNTPVVIYSSDPGTPKDYATDCGALAFLTSPVTSTELQIVLRGVMAKANGV